MSQEKPSLKEINVSLFDDKRDFITADVLYWVRKGTLFPFQSIPHFNDKGYDLQSKIESLLSLSKVSQSEKVNILADLTRKNLDRELTENEEDEYEVSKN